MDAMVSARVPVEVRDKANAIMKRLGIHHADTAYQQRL